MTPVNNKYVSCFWIKLHFRSKKKQKKPVKAPFSYTFWSLHHLSFKKLGTSGPAISHLPLSGVIVAVCH